MAEIQTRTETVTSTFYRLDLTQEEAEVLSAVLASVGGASKGYRGITQEILGLLQGEGIEWNSSAAHLKLSGSLRFQDTK